MWRHLWTISLFSKLIRPANIRCSFSVGDNLFGGIQFGNILFGFIQNYLRPLEKQNWIRCPKIVLWVCKIYGQIDSEIGKYNIWTFWDIFYHIIRMITIAEMFFLVIITWWRRPFLARTSLVITFFGLYKTIPCDILGPAVWQKFHYWITKSF